MSLLNCIAAAIPAQERGVTAEEVFDVERLTAHVAACGAGETGGGDPVRIGRGGGWRQLAVFFQK